MGEENALITDISKEIDFDMTYIKELTKYNSELGEKILHLNDIHETREYDADEWKSLYEESKESVALKIALLKAKDLPYEYEEKLIEEIPKEAIACIWESSHTKYDSVIKALEYMFEEDYDINNLIMYIRAGLINMSSNAINKLCFFPNIKEINYFPFEFLQYGEGRTVLYKLIEEQIIDENFWTALANNIRLSEDIRNKAIENNFEYDAIMEMTPEMAQFQLKIALDTIENISLINKNKKEVLDDTIEAIDYIITNHQLSDKVLHNVIDVFDKNKQLDYSIENQMMYNRVCAAIGKNVKNEDVLIRVLKENPNWILENEHMTEKIIQEFLIKTNYFTKKVHIGYISNMMLGTDQKLSESFYNKMIDRYQNIDFYCLLFCKKEVTAEMMKNMINNLANKKDKELLCYIRAIRNKLESHIYTNDQNFLCKIINSSLRKSKQVDIVKIEDEIIKHCKNTLRYSYLEDNQYEILKEMIKDLKKMYPNMKENTLYLDVLIEERYKNSKLFNRHRCIFKYTDDVLEETFDGIKVDFKQLCEHRAYKDGNNKWLLEDIRKENSTTVLYTIKNALRDHLMYLQLHNLDEIYRKVYQFSNIYNEIDNRLLELGEKKTEKNIGNDEIWHSMDFEI